MRSIFFPTASSNPLGDRLIMRGFKGGFQTPFNPFCKFAQPLGSDSWIVAREAPAHCNLYGTCAEALTNDTVCEKLLATLIRSTRMAWEVGHYLHNHISSNIVLIPHQALYSLDDLLTHRANFTTKSIIR